MNQNTSDPGSPSDMIQTEYSALSSVDEGNDNPPELSADQVAQFIFDLLDQRSI